MTIFKGLPLITGTKYDLEILEKCGKRVETKSQKNVEGQFLRL